jgi:hypothetical protein
MEEIIGTKINNWTILEKVHVEEGRGAYKYRASCACGKEFLRSLYYLKEKIGCRECNYERQRVQIALGTKIGFWTVVDMIPPQKGRRTSVNCVCRCGAKKKIAVSKLVRGGTRKCSQCSQVTHGKSYSVIYSRWRHMRRRCQSPKSKDFYNYGGRGIKVCDRWQSFENFYEDMGDPPFKGAQLDRIDPDGNYEPSNCRWVTSAENRANRRCSKSKRDEYKMIKIDSLCLKCQKNQMNLAI